MKSLTQLCSGVYVETEEVTVETFRPIGNTGGERCMDRQPVLPVQVGGRGEQVTSEVTVMPNDVLELVIRNSLTGDEQHLEICRSGTLRDLQAAVQAAFNIPPFEQILQHEDGDAVLGFGRFDDTRPISSVPKLSSDSPLMITRRLDTRPQAEKNCAFTEALRQGKLDEAMEVLDSSGVPVDPNCVGSFAHEGPGCPWNPGPPPPGGREFGDIRSATMPALCMAVMARCVWSPKGEVTGDRADDTSVVRVVERLLAMGASVDEFENEVRTCGSWPSTNMNKTALHLAVQTRSSALVRILLYAGADPMKGCYECQFPPGKYMPCESALGPRFRPEARGATTGKNRDDAVTVELRSLLRRKEYEVKISYWASMWAPSSTLGVKVSRRNGYWGFIDEIQTNGLIARWNQSQNEDGQVKVGDRIVAVGRYRAGISCYKGTAFLVDEERGWKCTDGDPQVDCFLASLLSEPQSEIVLTLTRTDHH